MPVQRKSKRMKARKQTGGRCWYCSKHVHKDEATLDHVIPLTRGGGYERSNLVFSCQPCNEEKGDKSLEQYRTFKGITLFWGERQGIGSHHRRWDWVADPVVVSEEEGYDDE